MDVLLKINSSVTCLATDLLTDMFYQLIATILD